MKRTKKVLSIIVLIITMAVSASLFSACNAKVSDSVFAFGTVSEIFLKGKKAKVNLKKVAQASGYEIMYSTNMNFTKKATKKVSTTKLTKTIRKLKKKKTYYIKARAYKLDGKTKVYGKWSLIKKVVIKK